MTKRQSLATLHGELDGSLPRTAVGSVEFIFVDDGSRDGSWAVLAGLARRDPRVRAIRFRRNFGKAAALTAGLPGGAGRAGLHARRRSPGRPGRDPALPGGTRPGFRRRQRLEENAARPLAQGLSQPRVQLDGQPPDGLPPARPQLRVQGLPPPGPARGRHLRRAAPLRAGAGARPRLSRGRESRSATASGGTGSPSTAFSRFFKGFLDLLTVRFLTRFSQRPLHVLGGIGLGLFGVGSLGMLFLAIALAGPAQPADRQAPAACFTRSRSCSSGFNWSRLGVLAELITAYQYSCRRHLQHRRDDAGRPAAGATKAGRI